MAHGTGAHEPPLYSLIPLEDFKAILGVDDREDKLSTFCLTTATFTIEQYCKRRLFRKKHTDYLTFTGEHVFTLREYPVRKVLTVHAATTGTALREEVFGTENLIDPKHYYCIPEPSTEAEGEGSPLDEAVFEDLPFSLVLRPPFRLSRDDMVIKVRYVAGYAPGKAPADLASACLELAAWNMARYRGKRIGITGNIRGSGKDGEHLESSMPENVRGLLEPYMRRVI